MNEIKAARGDWRGAGGKAGWSGMWVKRQGVALSSDAPTAGKFAAAHPSCLVAHENAGPSLLTFDPDLSFHSFLTSQIFSFISKNGLLGKHYMG